MKDTFYVVTGFISPTIIDLKFSKFKYDKQYKHLQRERGCTTEGKEHILDFIQYFRKIRPYVKYYR